jgi:hypothetical protein
MQQRRPEYGKGMDDGSIVRLQSVTMIEPEVTPMRPAGWRQRLGGDSDGRTYTADFRPNDVSPQASEVIPNCVPKAPIYSETYHRGANAGAAVGWASTLFL